MNAADWIEMAQTADANTVACFGILISLISGYLVVAYLVGKELTRAQVSIVNALYVVSALSVIAAHSHHNYEAMWARHHAHLVYADITGEVDPVLLILIPGSLALINIGLIISSLYFMWSIRHPRIEE